ncbi:MAG: Type 1 glutamine amidotransferase-like domain-containing protein [Candidatus Pacebacteria bacterium]|nr:Type 1 glutamine amidotransferase-like domain-containing protein [Candidatus Paceibacterota bacterium]
MKLYLTSNGLESDNVAEYFKNNVLQKNIEATSFLIVSVQDTESDAFYLQKTMDELRGVGAVDMDIFELKEERFDAVKDYDVIYVCGGNTFVYLDRIKKTGLDRFIIESVNKGSIYVGVSAGSIVVSSSIELAGLGDGGDINEIGLEDLSGLGLHNVMVFPHYSVQDEEMIKEFEKRTGYQLNRLSDNQALFVNDGIVSIVN